jgi:Asp-tRNA(Asn)/Glu-tRNA(Gln) amidotransferase A subunit family amidase
MNHISILDSYAYRTLVWDIYVERISRPASGIATDEGKMTAALPRAEVCLSALSATGPLAGLSVAMKDMYDIVGERTGGGNPDWLAAQSPRASTSSVAFEQLSVGLHQCTWLVDAGVI